MRGRSVLAALILAALAVWGADPAGSEAGAAPGSTGDAASAAGHVRTLLDADRWREALEQARGLLDAAPADPEIRTVLGEALYRAGRFDECAAALAPLAKAQSPPARALLTLGLVRLAEGSGRAGADLVERALLSDPADRKIVFWSASTAPSSAIATRRLEEYLRISEGDDPDRIEAARGSLRVRRALGDRETWIRESRPPTVVLPLRALGAGPATSGFVVEASLGGRKGVPLLLDTGSGGLFLVDRVARKSGFEPLAGEIAFGGGGDQRHATRRGILPVLALGDLRFRDVLASASAAEVERTGRYLGILGLTPFEGYRITIDLDAGRLLLDPPEPGAAGAPFWEVGGQILVAAGPAAGPSGLFLLDTGATSSVVDFSFASSCDGARIGPPTRLRGFGGTQPGARAVSGLRLAFQGVQGEVGGVVAADLSLRSRLAGVEVSGFLGLDVLRGTVITLDTVARRVRVSRPQSNRDRRGKERGAGGGT